MSTMCIIILKKTLNVHVLSLSLLLVEESESELLVELCAVLILQGVVVEGRVVSGRTDVRGLSELIASEQVSEEEASELKSVLVLSEDVLVVEEVGTEEDQQALQVHNLRVLSGVH